MATPRPRKERTWTQADHDDNTRRIQREADRTLWDRLGRKIGVRGRDFAAALGRMLDDRIAAALRTYQPPLHDLLKAPADADALRGALVEIISDDVVEIFQILNGQVNEDDTRDTEETPGRGGEDATFEQREIYGDEAEDDEAGDA